MTDTRRQAAEEWVDGEQEEEGLDAPAYCDAEGCLDDGIAYALEHAHLAGQECGEKREREAERAATVKWLREGMLAIFGIAFPTLADYIERGEHREEE